MGGEVLLLRTVRLASHTLGGLPVSEGLAFLADSGWLVFVEIPQMAHHHLTANN